MIILSAGISMDFTHEEVTQENSDMIFKTNFFGSIWIVESLIQEIRKTKGRIVMITSASSVLPRPRRTLYSASKAAAEAFFYNVQSEEIQKKSGVTITIARPGFVNTEMTLGVSRIGADCKPVIGKEGIHYERHGEKGITPEAAAIGIMTAAMKRKQTVFVPSHYKYYLFIFNLIPSIYYNIVSSK
jgi:short-subunit dehydrogenase